MIFSGESSELAFKNASSYEIIQILFHQSFLIPKQRPNKFPTQNATTWRR